MEFKEEQYDIIAVMPSKAGENKLRITIPAKLIKLHNLTPSSNIFLVIKKPDD